MTRSASRGISSKARTISASRRPPRPSVGTAAHMPCVELAAELLDQRAPRSSAHLHVALGDQLSPCPGFMRRNLIAGDYATSRRAVADRARRRASARPVRPRRRRARRPAPSSRRPSRTAAAAIRARAPRGLERVVARARGAPRAPTSACSPSRARRRRGGARRGSGERRRRRRSTSVASSRCPPVTTTRARAERVDSARASSSRVRRSRVAGEHARLGEVRA